MTKLNGVKIVGLCVYATATGIKIGRNGVVEHPANVFGVLSKSDARKLRKTLTAAGFQRHTIHRRSVPVNDNPKLDELKIAA